MTCALVLLLDVKQARQIAGIDVFGFGCKNL